MDSLTTAKIPVIGIPHCGERLFRQCYRSPAFMYAATCAAPVACFDAVANLLATRTLEWLVPLPTATSRQLFVGRLNEVNSAILPDLIFKRSNHHVGAPQTPLQVGVNSGVHEIRMALTLAALVDDLRLAGRLPVPAGFQTVSVRVETPVGILLDRAQRTRYTVYAFEPGLDTGERLLYSDPPFHGAANYSKPQWQLYCAIMGVLDVIAAEARQRTIQIDDFGVHQVLYRVHEQEQTLDVVLIDAERIHAI